MDRDELHPDDIDPTLPDGYLEAGREYHTALARLGFAPELGIWVRDIETQEWLLLLCTSLYDVVGPLEIMKVLFKAYDVSATPRSISPFNIRLQGLWSEDLRRFAYVLGGVIGRPDEFIDDLSGDIIADFKSTTVKSKIHFIDGMVARPEWAYVAGAALKQNNNAFKLFKSFRRAVELAA